ncbi:hypothetical protein AB1K54_17270 [Microbacterium sp. BWT-B31]|uniref:hypothetical protein n=1 Tax=Microbacterium sp. BWT-B31 TaxID=3232072 RepID=UPI0035284568
MTRRRTSRVAMAAIVTAALIALPGTIASASGNSSNDLEVTGGEENAPPWAPDSALQERLTLPPITQELLDAASAIDKLGSGDPRYNTVEVLPDRSGLVTWWHGEPSAELAAYAEASDVSVAFAESTYLPADLRRIAAALLSDPTSGVVAASIPKDGSAVEVRVTESARQVTAPPSDVAGVPIEVAGVGDIVPFARQNDIYAMGGARIYRFTGTTIDAGCSSGFPVQQPSTGYKGVVTASHCGDVGSQWVRWPNSTGSTVYAYGNNGSMVARIPSYDGAIIQTTFNNPGFYVSAWDSATYTALNGVAFVPVGAEICYSGSTTGLVCGNIVQETGYPYNLSGVGAVTGVRTVQSSGAIAAGEGDSLGLSPLSGLRVVL